MYSKDGSVAEKVDWMDRWSRAIHDILNGCLKNHEAARKYGVPAGSLSNRIKEIRKKKADAKGK